MLHRKYFLLAMLSLAMCVPAQAGGLPKRVGDCAKTKIKSVETRLENAPNSGSAVSFRNGGYQVSYDTVPAIVHSKAGDPVRMCLVSIPKHCPKGDHRGKVYRTTNFRTLQKLETDGFGAYVRRRVRCSHLAIHRTRRHETRRVEQWESWPGSTRPSKHPPLVIRCPAQGRA